MKQKKLNNLFSIRQFLLLLSNRNGQSMVEFLIVLPVLLLLLFGAIQFSLIYHAKITLNYAAFEGARSGTLGHGTFEQVQAGFARGLAPLYSYSFEDGKHHEDDNKGNNDVPWGWWSHVAAFQKGRTHVLDEFSSKYPFIRIERLNPTDNSFDDFGPGENNTTTRKREISNYKLRYRSHEIKHRSDQSIQEANLLQLRFTYWYPLYVPFVNHIIFDQFICCRKPPFSLFKDIDDTSVICKWEKDKVCQQDDPRIPITSIAAMRMQTSIQEGSSKEGYYQP